MLIASTYYYWASSSIRTLLYAAETLISIFNKFQYSLWLVDNVAIWIYYDKAMPFAVYFSGLPITYNGFVTVGDEEIDTVTTE